MLNKNNIGSIVEYKGEKAIVYSVNKTQVVLAELAEFKNNVISTVSVDVEKVEILEVNNVIDFYIEKIEKLEKKIELLEIDADELDIDNDYKIDELSEESDKIRMMILKNAVSKLA